MASSPPPPDDPTSSEPTPPTAGYSTSPAKVTHSFSIESNTNPSATRPHEQGASQSHPDAPGASNVGGGGQHPRPVTEEEIAGYDEQRDRFEEPPRVRRPTYTSIKNCPFLSPAKGNMVRVSNVIVMVGLPARGKTYISRKLCRYLNWIGIKTKVFNVGDYRRKIAATPGYEFFNPSNQHANQQRQKSAEIAMTDMCNYLDSRVGDVAIFDATNTTRERRKLVLNVCTEKHAYRVFFVESICEDTNVIESNIQDVKVNSPDYKDMDKDIAKDDFVKRIEQYRMQYEPIDDVMDSELSYIQLFNAGRSFFVNNIQGK